MCKKYKKIFGFFILVIGLVLMTWQCNNGSESKSNTESIKNGNTKATSQPLNLTIFVDLSDRIEKEKDNMIQADKDKLIINSIAEGFIEKQQKEGFQKSTDCFQVVFYPAPPASQLVSDSLSIDLGSINGPKKQPLNNFRTSYKSSINSLYDKALETRNYFGSDIWGFFNKDKVKDYYKDGYRNVFIILSDGYIFDQNNKIKDGNKYSYILNQTLLEKDSELIPCEISNPDLELYFMECNPDRQTDFTKMKNVLNNWFAQMGIKKIDIQDTDLPANVIKHLRKSLYP